MTFIVIFDNKEDFIKSNEWSIEPKTANRRHDQFNSKTYLVEDMIKSKPPMAEVRQWIRKHLVEDMIKSKTSPNRTHHQIEDLIKSMTSIIYTEINIRP